MKEQLNLVYLGYSGFPYGLAEGQRLLLISKALVFAGCQVTVVNRKGEFTSDAIEKPSVVGKYEGVNYIYTSGTFIKPSQFVKRNWLKVKGFFGEISFLKKQARSNKLDAAIISSREFRLFLLYKILSKLLNFPILLNFVEYGSEMKKQLIGKTSWNDLLFERYALKWSDGVLPISTFLTDFLKERYPKQPYLQIPVICDFDKFVSTHGESNETYFLFCGSLNYLEVVEFVLQAFKESSPKPDIYLYLVVNGDQAQQEKFQELMKTDDKKEQVKVFSKLPYEELVQLYLKAYALLIPLRNTYQDIARFPHKIGEYTASGKPIITSAVGEINYYFKDEDTALIASGYAPQLFAEKMAYVIEHPEMAAKIGQRSRQLGIKNFDYKIYGEKIVGFLAHLRK